MQSIDIAKLLKAGQCEDEATTRAGNWAQLPSLVSFAQYSGLQTPMSIF
jgi:hypothetical protein